VFGPKIKLSKELFEKVKQLAELSGYSSVDEFVAHVLEKEIAKVNEDDDKEKVKERLKGLGYIS
jgi:metal-responsive CopG/Arc/MetJ family transcriptional regulator